MNNYHSLSVEKTYKALKTQHSGLLEKEVNLRLKKYGHNKLPDEKNMSLLFLFLGQFKNP
ncbi:MAG: hypothetical protein K8S00_03295, partial [Bacteroidales bacterium]|nr:hypothetical protein [Bacteroidales bacterium]